MILEEIKIKNFRNYDDQNLIFNPKINVFIGDNAQGKTNILESIYTLAITKSHRTYLDSNLIKNGSKFAKIKGFVKFNKKSKADEMEVVISSKGKSASYNKRAIKKLSEYISNLNVIIFCPDDLELVKGSPSVRRKYLNIELGQLSNKYLVCLNYYNNILKNRNEYLKKVNVDSYDKNYLDILTTQLIEKAVELTKFRVSFINDLNKEMALIYKKIVNDKKILVKYDASFNLDTIYDQEGINKIRDKYEKNLAKDIILSQTTFGPHRDDFRVFIGEKEVKDFGSQGQQRMAVLCLKLAEISIFKNAREEYPILLLDDIFSELDNTKKNKLVKYMDKKMQIFITTTDINNIDKKVLKNATIFYVKNAKITIKKEVI